MSDIEKELPYLMLSRITNSRNIRGHRDIVCHDTFTPIQMSDKNNVGEVTS